MKNMYECCHDENTPCIACYVQRDELNRLKELCVKILETADKIHADLDGYLSLRPYVDQLRALVKK